MALALASRFPLLVCLAAAALPAAAEIYRCTSKGGAVTYQQIPCAASERATVLDLPGSYPAADPQERQRLFEREAALDRRLEAQRERDSREAVARAMQPPPQIIPAQPQLIWALPRIPFFHRHGPARQGSGSRDPRRG